MNKIIKSLSMKKSFEESEGSRSSSNKNKDIIISENFEKNLQNWKLPISSNMKIYRSVGFNHRSDYIIKTIEESIPLKGGGYDTFNLLLERLIELHRNSFKVLHLGMFQIGLKPLTKLGINNSALILVRAKRHNQLKDSLLGIVESSVCEGPIYFSCFPDFTLSLTDLHFENSTHAKKMLDTVC